MFSLTRLFVLFLCSIFLLISCNKDDDIQPVTPELTEDEKIMVDILTEMSTEVDTQALQVEDSELSWLDELGDKRVVGLGEATHGTKEFFERKGGYSSTSQKISDTKHLPLRQILQNHFTSTATFRGDRVTLSPL